MSIKIFKKPMNKNLSIVHIFRITSGFTLIELLVVIAIIGMLSAVVLASLNSARGKATDATTKSNLDNMRAQAENVYDSANPNSYAGVCINATVIKAVSGARVAEGAAVWATTADNAAGGGCYSPATGVSWVAYTLLAKGSTPTNYWCVDNTGISIQKTLAPATISATLPVSCGTGAGGAW